MSVAKIELLNGKAYEFTEDDLFNLTILQVDEIADEEDTEQDAQKSNWRKPHSRADFTEWWRRTRWEIYFTLANGLRKFKSTMSNFLYINPPMERSLGISGRGIFDLLEYKKIRRNRNKKTGTRKLLFSHPQNIVGIEERATPLLKLKTMY